MQNFPGKSTLEETFNENVDINNNIYNFCGERKNWLANVQINCLYAQFFPIHI